MERFFLLCFLPVLFAFGPALDTREFRQSKLTIDNDNVSMVVDSESVAFFVLGDSGGIPLIPYKTYIQHRAAKLMEELSKSHNTHFQILLGDNFYFHGVKSANDKRFKNTFEKVFDSSILKETPWFVTLGNHDHYGNPQAQVDYTSISKRWIFPSFNFNVDVFAGSQKLISIVMIDTILFCGNSNADESNQPIYQSPQEEQLGNVYFEALEKTLAAVSASPVPYIIVAGHFPVWSVGEHGPTDCLVRKLRPLLHKYGVSAYLSGHDHDLQHIQDTYLNKTVDYVISGCANFVNNNQDHLGFVPSGSLRFYWAKGYYVLSGGLVLMEADKNRLIINYFDTNGRPLYQTAIMPRSL